jgi:transposase-like protein
LLVPVFTSFAADAVCSLSLHVWKAILVSRLSLHVCHVCHFTFEKQFLSRLDRFHDLVL